MPNIVWSPQLALGNPELDNQHKELIRIVNSLLRALAEDRDKADFRKIFHRLREYTVFHFNNEEEFMRSINYPDVQTHINEHIELKRKVKDFQHDLFFDQKIAPTRLREMLMEWLVGHIINCDLKIKAFLIDRTRPQKKP